jgi:tight adherence protein B
MDVTVLAAALVGLAVTVGLLGIHQMVAARGQLLWRLKAPPVAQPPPRRTPRRRAMLLRPREGLPRLWWGEAGKGLALELERAGIPLRPGEFVVLRWALALVMALMALIFSAPWWVMLPLAILGYRLPMMVVRHVKGRRLAKIETQLLEALPLIANALRSGYSFLQAMDFVSKRVEDPLAWELARTVREIQMGANIDAALMATAHRVGSGDLELVINAIVIQRQVGGNLADLLTTVERTMRERARIRGEIKALTSQQRLSAFVIGSLPVFLVMVLMAINPSYGGLLFTTMVGRALLVTAAVMEVLGVMAIRRILRVEV